MKGIDKKLGKKTDVRKEGVVHFAELLYEDTFIEVDHRIIIQN